MKCKVPLTLMLLNASLVTVLLLGGCSSIEQEFTPEPSPTVTLILEPTATINWFPRTPTPSQAVVSTLVVTSQPDLPPPGISSELMRDDFSDTSLWTTTRSEVGNAVYGNQALSLAVAGDKGTLTSLSQHSLPANFYLKMKVNVALCNSGDQYGITFWRQAEGESHRLLMTCEGNLRLERFTSGSGLVLHDWEIGSRFMPGSPAMHEIAIWASQGEIRVFVNGIYQLSANTLKDISGGLGVMARAGGETAETIVFSDLVVYTVIPGE